MHIKIHPKRHLLIFAGFLFFITACSDMGSWDLINDQETNAARPTPLITLAATSSSIGENGGAVTIEITASKVWDSDISVVLSCGGSASVSSDYSISSTTLVIPAGSLSAASNITGIDDSIDEVDETIIVAVDSVVNGTEDGTQQAAISITDDDVVLVSLSLAGGGTIAEDGSSETVEVSLSAVSAFDITVNLAYGGNAANTVDYSSSSSITIPAGSTSGSCLISSVVDALDETNETITVDIDSVVNATENGTQQETITITDDDASPTIQFTAASSNGDESASPVSVELSLSAVSALAVDVNYSVSGGSANGSGIDYTLAAGTASIAAGTTTTNISIPIISDSMNEPSETIAITISAPVNGVLGGNTTHTYIINDNDAFPQVQFTATSSTGTEAATPAALGISLSAVSGQSVSVDYIVSGTATGGGTDYTLADGTATIPAGSTTATISAIIINDIIEESDEIIIVTLSNPGKATLGANTIYTYTITDNDWNGPAITTAEYYDTDSNGYLDHIKITLDETVNDSTFDGYGGANNLGSVTSKWAISGYSNVRIDTRDSIDGSGGESDSVIWLAFDEQTNSYDTGETPELTVTDASLQDFNTGNCYFNTSNAACNTQTSADLAGGGVTETDKAAPVIVDAVSDTGFNQLTVTFSEPVDGDGGTCDSLLDLGDFTYGDVSGNNVSDKSVMGTDCDACDNSVSIILNGSFTAADASTDTINAVLTSVYDSANNSANANTTVITAVSDFAAFYPFNGDANDQSGNGNHFTTITASLDLNRNSAASGSYYFDSASSNQLKIADPTDFDFTTEMTISVWVKLNNANTVNPKVIGKVNAAITRGYLLAVYNNQIYVEIWDSLGTNRSIRSGVVPTATWTHLAFTWKTGGKLRAYINGALIQGINAGLNPIAVGGTGANFSVGIPPWGAGYNSDGNIDDIRMYGRELSSTEIYVLSEIPAD
ncbi:MAG: hypothetical protein GY754_16505 [bacterium]|nr:hypothetical protein [bacterium]